MSNLFEESKRKYKLYFHETIPFVIYKKMPKNTFWKLIDQQTQNSNGQPLKIIQLFDMNMNPNEIIHDLVICILEV